MNLTGDLKILTEKLLSDILPGHSFPNKSSLKFFDSDSKAAVAKFLMTQYTSEYDIKLEVFQSIVFSFGLTAKRLREGLVITTKNLYDIYGEFISDNVLVLSDGESSKSSKELFLIYDFLLENNVTKSTTVKIFGGGALTDLASFASSTFKRGIPYELYPTSLLSQIDASIGGKTAIDYKGVKNLIGTFSIPVCVYIDPFLLITLPREEYINGLSEALKISMLTGESLDLFEGLDDFKDIMFFKNLILSSVRSKLKIVSIDPYDSNLRMSLNFGHTFGHVFESVTGSSHGISVLWGMEKELYFFLQLGLIDKYFFIAAKRYLSILENFTGKNLFDYKLSNTALDFLISDKKSSGDFIKMPVLRDFGDFSIKNFSVKEIKDYFFREIIQ